MCIIRTQTSDHHVKAKTSPYYNQDIKILREKSTKTGKVNSKQSIYQLEAADNGVLK